MKDLEAEKKLVEELVQGLCEADLSKDLVRIMSFFADDIIYHYPGRPAMVGIDDVRQFLDGAFDNVEDMKAGPVRTEISVSGELAYSIGLVKVKNVGSENYTDRKYLFVLRKTGDGWKIIAESVSRDY